MCPRCSARPDSFARHRCSSAALRGPLDHVDGYDLAWRDLQKTWARVPSLNTMPRGTPVLLVDGPYKDSLAFVATPWRPGDVWVLSFRPRLRYIVTGATSPDGTLIGRVQ